MIRKMRVSGFLFLQILCLCFLLGSCDINRPSQELSIYFGLKSLFEQQIGILSELEPVVIKKVTLDNQSEEFELQPDSNQWIKELEVFLESNINKPSLVGAFDETDEDNRLNYQRKDQLEDGVKSFEVIFYNSSDIPKEISISSSTNNSLYTSSRSLKLWFNNNDGKPLLSAYEIAGNQTILSKNATAYRLEAELKF